MGVFCKNCGTRNIEIAKFCENCGSGLYMVQPDDGYKGRNVPVSLIVAVVLVIAVVAGIFVLVSVI